MPDPDNAGSPSGSEPFFAEVTIANRKGLHARASAQFVKCGETFEADIRVTRDGQTVSGTSIMGLMTLAASQGQTIRIETQGEDGPAALAALVALVEAKFNEDE